MATIVQEGEGSCAVRFYDDDGSRKAIRGRFNKRIAEMVRVKVEAILAAMTAAIALTEWHKAETRRVYAMLDGKEGKDELAELVQWIKGRGGEVSVRDVVRSAPSRFRRGSAGVEALLNALAAAGRGTWVTALPPVGKGGWPRRVFRLTD